MKLETLVDALNREVGDVAPGPARNAKIAEVARRYQAAAKTEAERRFWRAFLDPWEPFDPEPIPERGPVPGVTKIVCDPDGRMRNA